MELACFARVNPVFSVSRRLSVVLAAALFAAGMLPARAEDKPLKVGPPLSIEKAMPIKEVCLLLRSGYTSDEVLREVATRRLLEPVDATGEAQLKTAGATPALLNAIKAGNYNLSVADAAAARARQADIEEREQVTHNLALASAQQPQPSSPQTADAVQPGAAALQPRSQVMANLLHEHLVTMRDGRFYRYDENKFVDKRLFAVYFSASWCPPCQKLTPVLVKFYEGFVKQHPEFELIFVSKDRSALAMEQYMRNDQMPWPAVPYEQIAQVPGLTKYAGTAIPDLVLLDDAGRVLSDSFREGKYAGPGEVIKDLLARVGAPVR